MKILSNKQYDLFLAQQGRIKQLQKENDKLKKEYKRVLIDLKDLQNFCMNFAADQKAKSIDFPNSFVERGLTGEAEPPLNFSDIIEL